MRPIPPADVFGTQGRPDPLFLPFLSGEKGARKLWWEAGSNWVTSSPFLSPPGMSFSVKGHGAGEGGGSWGQNYQWSEKEEQD